MEFQWTNTVSFTQAEYDEGHQIEVLENKVKELKRLLRDFELHKGYVEVVVGTVNGCSILLRHVTEPSTEFANIRLKETAKSFVAFYKEWR